MAASTSSFTNRGDAQCLESLKAFGIADVKAIDHDTVKTVDEWKTQLPKLPEGTRLAKNMFLKGKKGEQVLVVALAETQTDLKVVCRVTGAGSGNLRFAAEEILNQTLGVIQGAVTPLALINDTKKACTVVLDKALVECKELVAFHPCRNDQSVCILPAKVNEWITNHLSYKPMIVDFAAEAASAPAPAPKKDGAAAKQKKEPKPQEKAPQPEAGETRLGLEYKKMENFPMWYQQLITKAELIEYYDVSGCYILRPAAYAIWEFIQRFLDDNIKTLGVQNCYFPMFVSQGALEREKDHVEGFAPEVAWVTKAGQSDLEQPIAIRPTSETVMYPTFAKWIRSHRDLPLKLNQWCNVVRWEFSNPTPFIRTREFLWQEGHTAHATKEEADVEVKQILDFYRRVYEELLAVPCECGIKTEKEKFAGGLYTTTVETFVPAVGRGCQGATSHCLGQNFGKMFDITFEDPAKSDGSKLIPWQNSWGMTTRTIGVMLMNHADDTGLVLPPRVAQIQVVIVPVGVTANTSEADRKSLFDACTAIGDKLRAAGVRCKDDLRNNVTPGWKFNNWELKGVPIRIEVGPKELAKNVLTVARRFDGKKEQVAAAGEEMVNAIQKQLTEIQSEMLNKARAQRQAQTVRLTKWAEFVPALNNRCAILAPWCGSMKCEDRIKDQSADEAKALAEANDERAPSMGAKSLCIPFNQPTDQKPSEFECICPGCSEKGKEWVLFGRSY